MSDGITNIDTDGTIQCYVAPGRVYTIASSGNIVAYPAGMLVPVHPSDVVQFVADGIILPPGAEYVELPSPAPYLDMSGITKRDPARSPTMSTVACTYTPGTKVINLPSVPNNPGNLSVNINGFDYIGNYLVVDGQTVTMNFALREGDTVTANYA